MASAPTGRASHPRPCCAREAGHGANEAAATAQVDIEAALAWRDYMVSNYSDAGQERWLAHEAGAVKRIGEPEDIARAVVWLASDEAD